MHDLELNLEEPERVFFSGDDVRGKVIVTLAASLAVQGYVRCIGPIVGLFVYHPIKMRIRRKLPGHVGIKGNKLADQLARNGASTPFIGPEPVQGITKGAVREALRDWIWREHEKNWVMLPGVKHDKSVMPLAV
uniref:RNase H type-1 domain-containing protein n=1 Tax=Rhodnius prolixus TaxID=13249 RepID=T1IBG7_RHOPR